LLVRGGGAQSSIEGKIIRLSTGWPGLDIAAAFALGAGARAPTALAAGEFIQACLEFTRREGLPDLYLFTPAPPVSIACVEDFLRSWLCRPLI